MVVVLRPLVDASLRRRHRAAVLVQLSGGRVEDPRQRAPEEVVVVAVVVVLEGRDELRHRGQRPAGRRRLGADVEPLHQTPLLLPVLLPASTYQKI